MALILNKLDASPPARAAMMITEFLNKPVKFVDIDLGNAEHLDATFIMVIYFGIGICDSGLCHF